jgi:hypothetical protein
MPFNISQRRGKYEHKLKKILQEGEPYNEWKFHFIMKQCVYYSNGDFMRRASISWCELHNYIISTLLKLVFERLIST